VVALLPEPFNMFPKTNTGFKVASVEELISRGIDDEKTWYFSFPNSQV